jgi:hypothetical protein
MGWAWNYVSSGNTTENYKAKVFCIQPFGLHQSTQEWVTSELDYHGDPYNFQM